MDTASFSRAVLIKLIRKQVLEIAQNRKKQPALLHHLKIAGVKQNLFSDPAVTAIQQGSGGLFRKANHLARGAFIAAAEEQA
ncbi:hypothetical protein DFAR_2090031 [Desulfarculales bacterium]